MSFRRGAIGVALVVIAGASANAAQAATRYAAPAAQGTGDCSSPANPCTLQSAISGSAIGDTVILAGNNGTYGSASAPLASTISDRAADAPGTLEGTPGQPRPVIYSSANIGLNVAGVSSVSGSATALSDLDIEELAPGLPTALEANGNVDRVVARALNGASQACEPLGLPFPQTEVVSNSLCVATNGVALGESANGTDAQPQSVTLRNDTLFASGANSYGLDYSIGGFSVAIAATNVIAHGDVSDVAANAFSGGSVSIQLAYCNFASTNAGGGTAISGAGPNQNVRPAFVNAARDDFHEAAGSPTIDGGVTDPANGNTDLGGNPRLTGTATDIGAYEAQPPAVIAGAPSAVGVNQGTLNVNVNPNDLVTSVRAYVGSSTGSEEALPSQSVSPGLAPVALTFSAAGLKPGSTYHYHFVASNAIGTTVTGDQTLVTPVGGTITFASRRAAVRQSQARLRLSCASGSGGCRGTLRLGGAGKTAFDLPAGRTVTVVVNLAHRTLGALASHRSLKALAVIRRTDLGRATKLRITLTLG